MDGPRTPWYDWPINKTELSGGKMIRSICLLALGMALALPAAGYSQALDVKAEIRAELDFVTRTFQAAYGPREWKKEHLGWSVLQEQQNTAAILENKSEVTVQDYRGIMKDFFRTTHDYHVYVGFHSTETARLPLQIMGAAGKFFIVYIDRTQLDERSFPFRVGDEVVAFNGRPVADEVNEIRANQGMGVEGTDTRYAELLLTRRFGAMAMNVPRGDLLIDVKRVQPDGREQIISRMLTWKYTPEQVNWNNVVSFAPLSASKADAPSWINPQMTWGGWKTFASANALANAAEPTAAEENLFTIGGRKSYVPELGTVIWRSEDTNTFNAYIYRNEAGKLIGYVRIPHYMAGNEQFEEIKTIIQKFEGATDGLVIDQINNPGGSVFYVNALMSILSNKPIRVPDHHIAMYPAMVQEVADTIEQFANVKNDADAQLALGDKAIGGYPINYQFAQGVLEYSKAALAEWNAGHKLTRPLHLWGTNLVNPHPEVNYSKPIVVLVNELDFSGGDFFPAILQDNARVKVFGQRTSGAGGYVMGVVPMSSLGMSMFSLTGSLARRVNGEPIENLGVTPDIFYSLTERDMKEGFVEYKAAINKAISDIL